MSDEQQLHLRVYERRSELVSPSGGNVLFAEGPQSATAQARYQQLRSRLQSGFLTEQVAFCQANPTSPHDDLTEQHRTLLDALVSTVNADYGRALVALTVLQLCVKAIAPEQSIRLHKGRRGAAVSPQAEAEAEADSFSWQEGISMRSLDREFITPVLRDSGLVRLNRDGFMMTRSLAENYPYTLVYKAAIRGARREWLRLVEAVEEQEIAPLTALHYLLRQLLARVSSFDELVNSSLSLLADLQAAGQLRSRAQVATLIKKHIDAADYSARVMEVAMHSLLQAAQELGALGDATLVPLSQMRSANKKHGNIGDVELVEGGSIVEAWDAKYGKADLRDELEELNEKLALHHDVVVAGFVTSGPPKLDKLLNRIADVEAVHNVNIRIVSFDEWVAAQYERVGGEEALTLHWLTAYAETLARKRPLLAPVDEPSYAWLSSLQDLLRKTTQGRSRTKALLQAITR